MSNAVEDALWVMVERMKQYGSTRREIIQRLDQMAAEAQQQGLVPAETWQVKYAIQGELITINNIGMSLEKRGHIDAAIETYEKAVREGFTGSHAYERLRI